MKKKVLKWLILIIALLAMLFINYLYEIVALNIPSGKTKADGSFRVMTYNVNATLGDEDIESVRKSLVEEIDRHNPDILCLQELSLNVFKSIHLSIDSLFGFIDSIYNIKDPYRFYIYSKQPIRNFKRYKSISEIDTILYNHLLNSELQLLKNKMPFHTAEIEIVPDKWITVFACHLRSSAYSTARRTMDEDASWMDGIPLYYKNYKMGQMLRNWEADNIRLHLEALEAEDTPVIIAGDFNDWSGSYCTNTIRNGKYKDAWWEGGNGFGITYDGWHLKLRLDHILYSHHFKLENVYVEKSKFSDHRPLIADFTLLP